MRFIRALVILVTAISLCGYEAPDANEILRRSIKINEADWNTMPQYSYLERDISQKLDAKGHAKSETSKSAGRAACAASRRTPVCCDPDGEYIKQDRDIQQEHAQVQPVWPFHHFKDLPRQI